MPAGRRSRRTSFLRRSPTKIESAANAQSPKCVAERWVGFAMPSSLE